MRFRKALVLGVVVTTGCTASWNALVRYSSAPAEPSMSPESGIYAAILTSYAQGWGTRVLVVPETPEQAGSVLAWVGTGADVIRRHWADTLKQEVRAALADSALREQAGLDRLLTALPFSGESVKLARVSDSLTTERGYPVPRLRLSRPGFNADSTMAAVHVTFWCGGRCGHGTTLLLARRPGHEWRIWYSASHWIS
jgi:hypothetical protein